MVVYAYNYQLYSKSDKMFSCYAWSETSLKWLKLDQYPMLFGDKQVFYNNIFVETEHIKSAASTIYILTLL